MFTTSEISRNQRSASCANNEGLLSTLTLPFPAKVWLSVVFVLVIALRIAVSLILGSPSVAAWNVAAHGNEMIGTPVTSIRMIERLASEMTKAPAATTKSMIEQRSRTMIETLAAATTKSMIEHRSDEMIRSIVATMSPLTVPLASKMINQLSATATSNSALAHAMIRTNMSRATILRAREMI